MFSCKTKEKKKQCSSGREEDIIKETTAKCETCIYCSGVWVLKRTEREGTQSDSALSSIGACQEG